MYTLKKAVKNVHYSKLSYCFYCTGGIRCVVQKVKLVYINRMITVVGVLLCVAGATFWFTQTFKDNMLYYLTPTQALNTPLDQLLKKNKSFRAGGLVVPGSVKREGVILSFSIKDDNNNTLHVTYKGIAPELFAENKGVIAIGTFTARNQFKATQLLAKHDENYKIGGSIG